MIESPQTTFQTNKRVSVHSNDWVQRQSSIFAPRIEPNHAVLEYLCGEGELLTALANCVKAGIEPDAKLAAVASRRGLPIRANIRDFDGETFDRVLIGRPINQLAKPDEELKALNSLLAEDGRLLIGYAVETDHLMGIPSQHQNQVTQVKMALANAGYTIERASIERHSHRSSGFQFRSGGQDPKSTGKTFWVVKPFLAMMVVARKLTAG